MDNLLHGNLMESNVNKDREFAANWVVAQRTLSAFVLAAVPSFHDAEDVMQKVAMKAFEIRDRYDPDRSKFSTWVIGVARNEIQHWYRSTQRDRLVFDDDVFDAITDAVEVVGGQVSAVQEALGDCLKQVEGRARQILEMRYRESARAREIAEQLNTSESVVNVTLHRVRAALFNCIQEKIGVEGVRHDRH